MSVWQFIVNHLEVIAFWASIAAAFGGLAAILVVWFLWHRLEPHYQEHWAKIAVAFFRLVAAFSAVAAKPIPLDPQKSLWDQPWAPTLAIAAFGYFCWEVAGAWGDRLYKRGKDRSAQKQQDDLAAVQKDAEDAEYQATRQGWLLTHLRELVKIKLQRVRRVATKTAGTRASLQQAREGLAPKEQVRILLEWLASLFRLQAVHEDGNKHTQNFRIGLFVENNGQLVPQAAFDLATKSHDPFKSYSQHADRYHIDNYTNPSYAVRCIREGRMLIVEDCSAETDFYFHEQQQNYLRSMVATPIVGFCPDGITPARAALLVDTDIAGFFAEDDREMLELLLSEFVARIDLEYAISGLTD